MSLRLFFLFLIGFQSTLVAQHHQYQIEIDGHRAGSYYRSVETDQNIHTFTQLDILIKTLQDTVQFHQKVHFSESDSGLLQSIQWSNTLRDTISFHVEIKDDSVFSIQSDNTRKIMFRSSMLIGPERIRRLSATNLDTIGAEFCYRTFITEFQKPMEVHRELVGFSIEDAQKLRVVKETIGNTRSTIKKFDKDFYLIESESITHFGKIRILSQSRLQFPQFFQEDFFERNRLKSNILFADPRQIDAIKVTVQGLGISDALNTEQENQKVTIPEAGFHTIKITNTSGSLPLPRNFYLQQVELLWSRKKAESIIDSIASDNPGTEKLVSGIVKFTRGQKSNHHLALYQLALTAGIPARLVYGYAYDRWFWQPGFWVEMAPNDRWQTVDLSSSIPSNAALKIALYKSKPGETFSDFYLTNLPVLSAIKVESFELLGSKHAVSSQALPYYFENPVYENEGLGLRFNIPDGFKITDDGTRSPSTDFLTLKNDNEESITFSQLLIDSSGQGNSVARSTIRSFIGNSNIDPEYDKKLDLWLAFTANRGAIALVQGSSLIFIAIDHRDPESIIQWLTRKNLQFNN